MIQGQPETQFYAVYDGHGGLDASVYASKQLHLNLVKQETFTTDMENALKKCILQTDENFCTKAKREVLLLNIHLMLYEVSSLVFLNKIVGI